MIGVKLGLEMSRLSWIPFSVGIISMEIEGEECTRLFYFTLIPHHYYKLNFLSTCSTKS